MLVGPIDLGRRLSQHTCDKTVLQFLMDRKQNEGGDGERPEEEKSPQRHDKSEPSWAGCLCRCYHGLVQKRASYLRCLSIQSGWQPQLTTTITIFIYSFNKSLMITMWMPGTSRRSLGFASVDTLLLGAYILKSICKWQKNRCANQTIYWALCKAKNNTRWESRRTNLRANNKDGQGCTFDTWHCR